MSRFKNLIDQAKHRAPEPEPPARPVPDAPAAPPPPPTPAAAAPVPPAAPPAPGPGDTPPAPPRRGRPAGKKSKVGRGDRLGEFSQITAYVRTETRLKVGEALSREAAERLARPRELSELVQELLDAWLNSRV